MYRVSERDEGKGVSPGQRTIVVQITIRKSHAGPAVSRFGVAVPRNVCRRRHLPRTATGRAGTKRRRWSSAGRAMHFHLLSSERRVTGTQPG